MKIQNIWKKSDWINVNFIRFNKDEIKEIEDSYENTWAYKNLVREGYIKKIQEEPQTEKQARGELNGMELLEGAKPSGNRESSSEVHY